MLIAYAAGRNAEATARLPRNAVARRVSGQVSRVFPGASPDPVSSRVLAWGSDPYFGGAYSAWAPGQVASFWTALRRPHGRLHFAGEHTAELSGYMEGAIRSGQRAAAEVIAGA